MSAALFTETLRRTYVAQRGVSQGAHITLAASSGGYTARFECAKRAAGILGTRNLQGDLLTIPTEDLHKSITKLAETFSVALVDTVTDESGTRFVLVWRIEPAVRRGITPTKAVLATDVLLGTAIIQPYQGSPDPLDEY